MPHRIHSNALATGTVRLHRVLTSEAAPSRVHTRRDLLQGLLDVGLDVGGGEVAAETLDELAVLADKELLEVPGNVGASDRGPQGDGGRVEGAWRREMGCVELSDGRAAC